MTRVTTAAFAALDVVTLYDLLRLRVDVFVVEQDCAYPELDGRDTESSTRHCWIADHGRVVACLRLLAEPDGSTRLGRLATARDHRGRGLAAELVTEALAVSSRPVVAAVQSHLVDWYTRFDFVTDGQQFIDDGIPHTPMRLR